MQGDSVTSDSDLSAETARLAGELLLELRSEFGELEPDDKEAVRRLRAEGDRRSNDLILERLRAARPGDAVLSEESTDDLVRLGAERVWIVDPLDGTFEYGQGRSDFAVHIALWRRGNVLSASTVELPAQGLTRTDVDPAPTSWTLPQDRPVRIVASRTRPPRTLARAADLLAERLGRPVEVFDVGSVGAKVNEILSLRADAYVHDTGFYEWDVAAPYSVAHRYGLRASHIDLSDVQFNQRDVLVRDLLVATPAVHDELVAALREAEQLG